MWRLLVLAAALAGVAADDDASKKDLKAMQGHWKLQSFTLDGEVAPPDDVKAMRVVVEGNKWKMVSGKPNHPVKPGSGRRSQDDAETVTITLDAAKKPAAIDFMDAKRKEKNEGIYQLGDDTLKVCFNMKKGRPVKFASKKGSEAVLLILQRDKK